jgi:outer membrane receptor protein involved in Fe transport
MRQLLSGCIQPCVKKRYRFRELESVRIPVRHIGDDHELDIFNSGFPILFVNSFRRFERLVQRAGNEYVMILFDLLKTFGRASFYGSWIDADFADDDPADPTQYTLNCANDADQCFDFEWIFDVEAAYTFADKYSVIVGAQNVFDEFGPVDKNNLDGTIGSGNTYSQSTPFGQDGGFWYLRFRAEFN